MIAKLCLIFITFLTACSVAPVQENSAPQSPTPKKELKLIIPNESWVKIFFEGMKNQENPPGLDKIAARNGFPKLRETVLPDDDFEIRVWVGFGKYGNDGFVLRKKSSVWSAVNIRGMLCHLNGAGKYNLNSPKSGWENFRQKLVDAGVLTLSDSSELEYKEASLDGKSYVVEINHDYVYRTYEYSNPRYVKVKEYEQIMKIGGIIADEFGLESFNAETDGCGKNEPE